MKERRGKWVHIGIAITEVMHKTIKAAAWRRGMKINDYCRYALNQLQLNDAKRHKRAGAKAPVDMRARSCPKCKQNAYNGLFCLACDYYKGNLSGDQRMAKLKRNFKNGGGRREITPEEKEDADYLRELRQQREARGKQDGPGRPRKPPPIGPNETVEE